MAEPARNPLEPLGRGLTWFFRNPLGRLLALPLALLLAWAAYDAYYFVVDRPGDEALLASKVNVDLSNAGSLDTLTAALGPPVGHSQSSVAQNGMDYWWAKDAAVKALIVDGTATYIDIGNAKQMHLLPFSRPAFAGSFLGLRIGQTPPSGAVADDLRARAKTCCEGSLSWDVKDGKVAAIHFSRSDYYFRPA